MKTLGQVIAASGMVVFFVGLIWLRYLVVSLKDLAASFATVIVGVAIAGIGGGIYRWSQSRIPISDSSP